MVDVGDDDEGAAGDEVVDTVVDGAEAPCEPGSAIEPASAQAATPIRTATTANHLMSKKRPR